MLLYAVITINLAFVFYSIGVWSEKFQGTLKNWHVVVFWIGFIFDTLGTSLMSKLTEGSFNINLHGLSGFFAIVLMLIHAIWASYVTYKRKEKSLKNFHKFSIIVWLIWLIPFLSGAIIGMAGSKNPGP